ncbi:MAG: serine hydrolase, partial [Bacteroidia bacterium]|nr:serine hydrolase [Bacteroidia bacterium]
YENWGYGYGWEVDEINRQQRVYHGGALVGYASHVSLMPNDEFAVVILSNGTFRDEVSDLVKKILFFYY